MYPRLETIRWLKHRLEGWPGIVTSLSVSHYCGEVCTRIDWLAKQTLLF